MDEYFKNIKDRKALQEIIESTTAEHTEDIISHFKEVSDNIRWQIDELDRLLGVLKSEKEIPKYDIYQLKDELEESMNNLSEQLSDYDEQHPIFHFNLELQKYNEIAEKTKNHLIKLGQKKLINENEGRIWEIEMKALLEELKILEKIIKNNIDDIDISQIPPAEN